MKRILIVDDEPMVLRSTQTLLSMLGFQAEGVADPDEVVAAARRWRPDVILQDVRMPGLDIDALVNSLRADPVVGRTPVILFSASADVETTRARLRAAGVLAKPFKPTEAVEAIQRVTT